MLVRNWMNSDVVTISIEDSMQNAIKLLKENDVGLLPVMKKRELVGVITDRDLKEASASDATTLDIHEMLYLISKIKVKDIMSSNPISVSDELTIEETAELLLNNHISGAPVLDSFGAVVGTITKAELFKVLISLTGIGTNGIQFAFEVEDRAGSIREVADIIRDHDGRMVSILSTYDHVEKGYRKVYIRMTGIDRGKIDTLVDKLKNVAKLLYTVDHKHNIRKVYNTD